MHLENKLTNAHIIFFKQLVNFTNCVKTVRFIRTINRIFDILNSRKIVAPFFKQELCEDHIERVRQFICGAKHYLNNLRFLNGKLVVNSKRRIGFVGVMISLKSAEELFNALVVKNKELLYLPLYKVSQDHIELFFFFHAHVLESVCNHIYFLMKAIAMKYIKIRLHFIVERQTEQSHLIRKYYSRLILFKGQ